MLLSTDKVFVTETLSIFRVTGLMKVVHIELPDETREVIVLKVFRQDMLCKLVCFIDNETGAV